ncbi:DUF5677 domain-containing protein [Rhizobium redzepovicii]|uniref:DUF5677 domain-containing protein n=1 Tax=Rhizobium redzepovicii TaxID=2867518 RepID=A0AAW8PCY8_9HYPH|nr:DUF5677 domain-containing protein [Rhizobium redzepovicii]MDR9764410.1 DUF5677 domain-containing protein [Rhizobium redzepovicii]
MLPLTTETMPEISKVAVDVAAMAEFTSEEGFMSLAVDLAIETGQYVCVAACTTGKEQSWSRDQAAIGGNMVRIYKLIDAMLDQHCKLRGETSFMLARLVFETIVNVRYLIANFSPALIDSYVEYSLRHEKKLWDDIAKNIVKRNGVVLPIEERMQKSIERAFDAACLSIDAIDPKKKSPWGNRNLYEKAQAVSLDALYLSAFGGTSHGIHGAWEDICGNNLHWDGSRFTPNIEWSMPRPQLLLALCPVIVETVYMYFEFIGEDSARDMFAEPLQNLVDRIASVSAAHEAYLGGKTWPNI